MRWVVAVLLVGVLVAGAAAFVLVGRGGEESGEVRTVTITADEGEDEGAASEPGLPEAVVRTRDELLAAADAGDHERLAELAADDFSYTFGGPVEGGPAAYWHQLEAQGERPLATLAAILRLPYALAGGLYVWPFVHATDPAALTEYERGLLADIPGGAEIGEAGYLGWRAGIAPDGAWRFFVAGD